MPTIRQLRVYPDPILHEVSEPATEEDSDLIYDMFATMQAADGIGLSAVQVGVLKRIIVLQDTQSGSLYAMYNPVIIEKSGEFTHQEGCLSVPGVYEERKRYEEIRVQCDDLREGGEPYVIKSTGLDAFCIQHEIDHLDGKVFIDDYSQLKINRARDKIKKTLKTFRKEGLTSIAYRE